MSAPASGGGEWDARARYILSFPHPPGHREAWEALLAERKAYPRAVQVPAWERPQKDDRWRPLAVAGLDTSGRVGSGEVHPCRFTLYQPQQTVTFPLVGEEGEADRMAATLFSRRLRGRLVVFLHGGKRELQGILRWYARRWADLGYQIKPLTSGSTVRAIIVSKGRQAWSLCDVQAMTGLEPEDVERDLLKRDRTVRQLRNQLPALYKWLCDLQRVLLRELRTSFRATVGGTAIVAASRFLPKGEKVWRPKPALIALCRVAGAYRGGYVMGSYYKGQAYKADVRRLYTACLRSGFPLTTIFRSGTADGVEQDGIFLCTVRGRPRIPPYVTLYDPVSEGFWSGHWEGGENVMALPSSEYAGLRKLGLEVEPGYGYAALDEFTLSAYVDALQRICAAEGAESAAGQLTKWLGNTPTGKWGSPPERETLIYSALPPTPEAFPATTLDGAEIPGCWYVKETEHLGYQQPQLAALVTGAARTVLYTALCDVLDSGEIVLSAHTDGYIATGTPPDTMKVDEWSYGAWRIVGQDPRAVVAGAGRYAVGRETRLAGEAERSRRLVEIAYERGVYRVGGEEVKDPTVAGGVQGARSVGDATRGASRPSPRSGRRRAGPAGR